MLNLIKFFVLVLSIYCESSSAMTVFDPANFAKNTISAAQNAAQTTQLIQSNMYQYQQLLNALQNIKNLNPLQINTLLQRGISTGLITSSNPTVAAQQAAGVYANYQQLNQTMQNMSGLYGNLNGQMNTLNAISVNSGLTTTQILAAQAQQAANGATATAQQYLNLQNIAGQLGNFQSRADAIAAQIPANQGVQQSMSTLSAQNGLISDQISGLLQVALAQGQVSMVKANKDFQKESQSTKNMNDAISTTSTVQSYLTGKSPN